MRNHIVTLTLLVFCLTFVTKELSAKEPDEVTFTIIPIGWERYQYADSIDNDSYRYLHLAGVIKNVSKDTIYFCYVGGMTTAVFEIDNKAVWFRHSYTFCDKYSPSFMKLAPGKSDTSWFNVDCRSVVKPETFRIFFYWTFPLKENGSFVRDRNFLSRDPYKLIESNPLTVSSTTVIK